MDTNTMELDSDVAEPARTMRRLLREQGRMKGWLAEQMGIPRDRLTNILKGTTELRFNEVVKAAEALNVPVETFLPRTEAD
jgi:antitoxin component HigA of HigAB toxin-antitoxin module